MKQKVLALVLALCMVISMLPVNAFAAAAKAEDSGMMTPNAVGKLDPPSVLPNAKSYTVTLSSSGSGEARLLVSSPAPVGSQVLFLANPDDGYLAEIYYDGLDADDLVYMGADIIGFIMPSNRVTLQVKFVAAEGSEHNLEVYESSFNGEYVLTRNWAKPYESVLLAVQPYDLDGFDPEGFVWVSGASAYYLFEDEGIHYYEIIMGSKDVSIYLCYERSGPFSISTRMDGVSGGTVTLSRNEACVNDSVSVTIQVNPGYRLVHARAVSHAGDLSFDLTPTGNNQYTFRMHPGDVELHILFAAEERTISVTAGAGGKAYASASRARVGDSVTLTCVPDAGYRVASITGVDNLKDNGDNTYSFTMPAYNVSISVSFLKIYNPITVTVDGGIGGTAAANVAEAKAGETVTLTCTPDAGYRVASITGAELTDNGDGTYTFIMPDRAVDITVLFLREDNPFLDVNETHFFYEPVLWAVEQGITNGVDAEHFGPMGVCNRAQVVTFLWRAAGSPAPAGTENPFDDVAAGTWYTDAVLWAVEQGITNGLTETTFGPTQVCNRAQVVTFLHRAKGSPVPNSSENPFTDVPAGSFYTNAVLWALENGVTSGAAATTFNPGGDCLRAQVVTFLYRAEQIPEPDLG